VRDRKARAGASAYLAHAAGAESAADQPGNSLTQRLMGIPGDRDRLSVKVLRKIDRSPHGISITSSHHDAMMSLADPGTSTPGEDGLFQVGYAGDAAVDGQLGELVQDSGRGSVHEVADQRQLDHRAVGLGDGEEPRRDA